MAVFVEVVNRTTRPLDVRFDGVPYVLPPGYVEVPATDATGQPKLRKDGRPVMTVAPAGPDGRPRPEGPPRAVSLPAPVADAAKRQHPIYGTEDPYATDARSVEYLVGVPAWGDEISHVEQSTAVERLNRSLLPPDRQNVIEYRPPGVRRSRPKESPGRARSPEPARGLPHAVDAQLVNPAGIRGGG